MLQFEFLPGSFGRRVFCRCKLRDHVFLPVSRMISSLYIFQHPDHSFVASFLYSKVHWHKLLIFVLPYLGSLSSPAAISQSVFLRYLRNFLQRTLRLLRTRRWPLVMHRHPRCTNRSRRTLFTVSLISILNQSDVLQMCILSSLPIARESFGNRNQQMRFHSGSATLARYYLLDLMAF